MSREAAITKPPVNFLAAPVDDACQGATAPMPATHIPASDNTRTWPIRRLNRIARTLRRQVRPGQRDRGVRRRHQSEQNRCCGTLAVNSRPHDAHVRRSGTNPSHTRPRLAPRRRRSSATSGLHVRHHFCRLPVGKNDREHRAQVFTATNRPPSRTTRLNPC